MRSWLPAVLLTLSAGSAHAHDADVIFVELSRQDDRVAERVTMTAATLAMLAPVDADGDGQLTQADLDARGDALKLGVWDQAKLSPCSRANETAVLQPGYVELTAQFTCGEGELSQEFRWLMVLPENYRVQMGNQAAQGSMRTLHVGVPAASGGRTYVVPTSLVLGAVLALVAFLLKRRRIALGLIFVTLGFALAERFLA